MVIVLTILIIINTWQADNNNSYCMNYMFENVFSNFCHPITSLVFAYYLIHCWHYHSVLGKYLWVVKHILWFRPTWVLTWDIKLHTFVWKFLHCPFDIWYIKQGFIMGWEYPQFIILHNRSLESSPLINRKKLSKLGIHKLPSASYSAREGAHPLPHPPHAWY